VSGSVTLRDGVSAGASCTVSPSFASTFVFARQAFGRVMADTAAARKIRRNVPTTSRLCLKTA